MHDRVFFVGRTGSGKTTLARALLHSQRRTWVVLDPKGGYEDAGIPIVSEYRPDLPHQIIRKPYSNLVDAYDADLARIYQRGLPVTVYVDEITMVTRQRPPSVPLAALIRTGRQPGMVVWSGTQLPMDVPRICWTEAEHIFAFHLSDGRDRERVAHFTGDCMRRELGRLRGHEYAYYNVEHDQCLRTRLKLPGRDTVSSSSLHVVSASRSA